MPHGYLEWNVEELRAAMHLNAEDVLAYFTDGRRVSFMLERRIMREVLGGRLAASEGDDHDLVDSQGRKWEVRSVSAGGYVISDITQFPRIPYWLVEAQLVRRWWDAGQLATATRIPRWRALDLLGTVR